MTAVPFGDLVENDNVVAFSVTLVRGAQGVWEVILYVLRLLP